MLLERYRGLPRAAKWGVWAVGAVLVFEAWNVSGELSGAYGARAHAASARIAEYEERMERMGGGVGARAVARHGAVVGPGEADERQAAMSALFDGLVEELSIGDGWRRTSQSGPLREEAVSAIFGGRRIERLVFSFSFESDAETAAEVVERLEASPLVVRVPRVTMRVVDSGAERVGVRVDAETWVFAGGRS